MIQPAYPAARRVAAYARDYFARLASTASRNDSHAQPPRPDAESIEAVIDAAFWASLRHEEGSLPTISLALAPPGQTENPLMLENPLPLAAYRLSRLAPAVERPGIHLGVWHIGDELFVWGTTRTLPESCFVLEVVAPGLLVIKQSRSEESGKFINVAVLEGDHVKVLDQTSAMVPDCPSLLTSLLGFEPASTNGSVNMLIQLAVSMRAHRRGGALLVVPGRTEAWRASILRPISYPVAPPFSELADLMREDAREEDRRRWQETVRRAVDAVAGLTAVDGATVINSEYEVLAFGAKIGRREGQPQVENVLASEPVEGSTALLVDATQVGGTRHVSAAQFCQDQRDTLALVASESGRFTVFAWSPCDEVVHAYRIEALLL